MGDVGPVDWMRQVFPARTSARNMDQRVEGVRLPQGLNERRQICGRWNWDTKDIQLFAGLADQLKGYHG